MAAHLRDREEPPWATPTRPDPTDHSPGIEMDLSFTADDEGFRDEIRTWLAENLRGDFSSIRFRGGPGDEHMFVAERIAWEQHLAAAGWTCVGWPEEHGGRGLPLWQEVIFHEEYARAGGPGRAGLIGEGLLGPTIIHFGSREQQQRYLPGIVSGTEYWCQGYSEPNAGSDLANIATRGDIDGDHLVINGQKVWTSLAQWADWCFVLCRTDRDAPKHKGISYVLVPMDAEGIEVRPIRQIIGTAEFNELFFNDVRTPITNVVGEMNSGWKVAMGTLAFERGTLTLGQQMAFEHELNEITELARANGAALHPLVRQRLADLWTRLHIMRWNALRTLSVDENVELGRAAMIGKLFWADLHQAMGELAVDVAGAHAGITGPDYELDLTPRLFLYTRADTIYGGSDQIQRNIVGERALGLPREPSP
ncbi:MAG: putative acyl-CoA dehydrogenase FadE17 [Acidimicrobiales bacterium]|nr:putative acyl-CoA dehydrogenase FadE17 [Acidimicrobiales bacterium]